MYHSEHSQISHKTGAMRRCEAGKVKRVGEAAGTREDGDLSEKEITEQAEKMWLEYHGDYPPDKRRRDEDVRG